MSFTARRLPLLLLIACVMSMATFVRAAEPAAAAIGPSPKARAVAVDAAGVIRWTDTGDELALFGANYCLPSASDYRAAGHVTIDRKRVVDVDMAHFARMGFDGLRLSFWGDYENADAAGNLLANDHLDLLCYVIARARERGIYMLLSPIVTHSSQWPDAMGEKPPGFSEHFPKREHGTNPAAIAAQANYLGQLLNHVNPYTGVALKDEPSILLIELINEPWHHSRDVEGSVQYINALADAVRATGCDRILFHNVSQDYGMAGPIRASKAAGVTFGWYPTGLVAGHALRGNFLRAVDAYPEMLRPELSGLPRIVYEFDQADVMSPCMYPAMARAFRGVGAQFAAMFSYDMIATAPYNLGWQTHYLNLVHTPQKAVSAVIAGEAMRRLPRTQSYGAYPQNTRFGDFRVSYEEDLSELVTPDTFMHAGMTRTAPPQPEQLRRIVGFGSSPVVSYEGVGSYFLDKVCDGVWRLEVYPDAVLVDDPYEPMRRDKVVSRVIHRAWPMRVTLAELGSSFHVHSRGEDGAQPPAQARDGTFKVAPGVYALSRDAAIDTDALPKHVGGIGFDEYHAPETMPLPATVHVRAAEEYGEGEPMRIAARVVDETAPDEVVLSIRPVAGGRFQEHRMNRAGGYDYELELPAGSLRGALHAFCVTVVSNGQATTFPDRIDGRPTDWNFHGATFPPLRVVPARAPLRLFAPAADVPLLSWSRSGSPPAGRGRGGAAAQPLVAGSGAGEVAFHFETAMPRGRLPEDFTTSLFVGDKLRGRTSPLADATAVVIKARALAAGQALHVTLVETDGTGWTAAIAPPAEWGDVRVPLSEFKLGRSVALPEPYPGTFTRWIEPAAGRGGAGDGVRMRDVERIQFSIRRPPDAASAPATTPATPPGDDAPTACGAEIESVVLRFD